MWVSAGCQHGAPHVGVGHMAASTGCACAACSSVGCKVPSHLGARWWLGKLRDDLEKDTSCCSVPEYAGDPVSSSPGEWDRSVGLLP